MKKLIAIALLGLQMFAICGHILLYQYFVCKAEKTFSDRVFSNQYNPHDLVEVKIPIHTAITQSWTDYELINGQIQFKNTCYNYIKLKLTADTIYLVCVPNHEKTRLFNQNAINAKAIDDVPLNKKDHVPSGKIVDLSNYSYAAASFQFLPSVTLLRKSIFLAAPGLSQRYITIPLQPPKQFC